MVVSNRLTSLSGLTARLLSTQSRASRNASFMPAPQGSIVEVIYRVQADDAEGCRAKQAAVQREPPRSAVLADWNGVSPERQVHLVFLLLRH